MSAKEKKAAESSENEGFLDETIVKPLEKKQQPRRVANQDDDLKLPEKFKVARAIGGGDCFFDSIAKGLKQIRVDEKICIKQLRELCHKYAIENEWVKSAVVKDARITSNLHSTFKDDDIWNVYLFRICYTGDDIVKLKSSDEDLYSKLVTTDYGETLLAPIWGRTEIEGRIVCEKYNVMLHIVEKLYVDGKRIRADQIVDRSGSKSVDSVDYNDVNTIHILNGGKAHFKPILDTQKFKHKRQCSDPSVRRVGTHDKEITPEEELINTIESIDLQECSKQQREKKSEKFKVQTRKGTTGGLDGHFFEIHLLILIKFRGERYTDKFYLTTNMGGVGAFDDIVFRYWNKKKSTLILLQAKHLENPNNHKVTIEKFTNQNRDSKFYLGKYFVDYLISRNVLNKKSKDPALQGDFQVRYIIYTNAILDEQFDKSRKIDIDDSNSVISTKSKENKNKAFKFSLDDKNSGLITMLKNVSCQERIKSLAKALVSCIRGKLNYNNMMGNGLFLTYHVFLARNVIDITEEIKIDETKIQYREGKFKNDFLNNDKKDQLLKNLKDEVLYEYANKVMFNKKSSTELGHTDKRIKLVNKVLKLCVEKEMNVDEDIIQKLGGSAIILDEKDRRLKFANENKLEDEIAKQFISDLKSKVNNLVDVEFNIPYELVQQTLEDQLQKVPLKLHISFGNISPRFNKRKHLIKQIIKLFEKHKSNKVIEIDDNVVGTGKVLTDGDIKNIGKLVGNLLVFDQEEKMLRLATEENLDKNTLNFFKELKTTALKRDLEVNSYRFDIKVEKFPKGSLDINDEDRTNVENFFNELEVFTGQASDQELRKIIKNEIKDLHKLTDKEVEDNFLKIKEKGEEYWRAEEKYYLEKNDGLFEEVLKFDIVFELRNSDTFIGREEQLQKLHMVLQSRGETAILEIASICGLGGIGKTELARKYAFDYRNYYDGNVIWINSESFKTLSESFRRLAQDKLGINVKEKHINSIVVEVYDFFSKRKSLFIFDNAVKWRSQVDGDDGIDNFLPSLPSNAIKPHILITSRNQKWGDIEVMLLGIFSEKEATDFIRKQLKIKDDSQKIEIQKLSETLQQFPLALTQAVAYIKQVDEQVKHVNPEREFNIDAYLKEFEKKKQKLLDFPLPDDSNNKYNRTTFTTFQVSIDMIKKQDYGKNALDILEMLAYYEPDYIPSYTFIYFGDDDDINEDDAIRELGAAIQLLTQYSMINSDDGILSVHRLVQEVTRINLINEGREQETLDRAVKIHNQHLSMFVPRLLRPNPDWEQDIEDTCVIDDVIKERIASYTRRAKKKRNKCTCQICENGVAPWIQLNDGRQFPALGLGTWLGLNKTGGRVEVKDEEVRQAVEWAIDAGYRQIDTAFIYNTEEQVGKAVNNKIAEGVVKREDLFITTKLWNDKHAQADVVPALRKSLEILNLTYVDLYLIHWPVATTADGSISETDYVDTWRGMIEARDQGLTKSIGVSNFNVNQLDRLMAVTSLKPAVLQVEINLNLQQPALLAFCRSHNITVTGYTPFGSLFYRKASEDAPPPRVDDAALSAVAAKYKKSVPQLTLRYLHELGVVPIPKSVTKKRIKQNLDIFDFTLTPQEREMMKGYDRNYRTIPVKHWITSPYYPFEKNQDK